MLTPSLEDYLEEIYNCSIDHSKIRVGDIAHKLEVSPPSVVKGLKKLEQEGYIIYEKYKDISLTPKGLKEGHHLVERNQVLQNFFKTINQSCDPIQEAEACEHYLSPSTIHALKMLCAYFHDHPLYLNEFISNYLDNLPSCSSN